MPHTAGLSPQVIIREASAPVQAPARMLPARPLQAAFPRGLVRTTSRQVAASHTATRLSSPAYVRRGLSMSVQ